MATFKLNPFTSNEYVLSLEGTATIKNIILEGLHAYKIDTSEELLSYFTVLVDGQIIAREDWEFCYVTPNNNILITIIPRGDNVGRSLLSIGLLVGLSFLAPGVGGFLAGATGVGKSAVWGAVFVATGSFVGGLALNALIPIKPEGTKETQSQVYFISGQRNSINLYGTPMKVYGTHKVFPYVAANPYTELVVSSKNTTLQYYSTIFDFGLGRVSVSDIKIGDTLINRFTVPPRTNLFDPNSSFYDSYPNANDGVNTSQSLYYGDNQQEDIAVELAKEGDSIVRTCADSGSDTQEIIITIAYTNGLISYNSRGDTGSVRNVIEIYYAPTGTNNWKAYNNGTSVSKVIGGRTAASFAGSFNLDALTVSGYYQTWDTERKSTYVRIALGRYRTVYYITRSYGFKKGTTVIKLSKTDIPIGAVISMFGYYIGRVASKTSVSGGVNYTLTSAIPSNIVFDTARVWVSEAPDYPPTSTISWNSTYIGDVGTPVSPINQLVVDAFNVPETTFEATKATVVYGQITFKPINPGQYDIRITKGETVSQYSNTVLDTLTVVSINTRISRPAIKTKNSHTYLEMKFQATNQISGSLDNLSAIITSYLKVWDGSSWSMEESSNPAWVVYDLLTNPLINKNAVSDSRIDLPSFYAWAQYCDEFPNKPGGGTWDSKRFECNFVLDYSTTLREAIETVCGAAGASLTIYDGKYGVLIDKANTLPVQMFTPRNSRDFSSTRNYKKPVHALKVNYIDPAQDWQQNQVIVYNNGYTSTTASIFEEITAFACTNVEQAMRYGKFMLAHYALRQETIQIVVDFEHLVCTRGDYVVFANDVMKVGGKPCRVKSITGTQITTDETISYNPALSYGYSARTVSGIVTSTLTVVDENTFNLNGTTPSVGDLIIIGEVGQITYDLLVKSIEPNEDYAILTLIEQAPEIYNAESSGTVPTYNPYLSLNTTEGVAPPAITGLSIDANTYTVAGTTYQYYIDTSWDALSSAIFEAYEVYVDYGNGYLLNAIITDDNYRYIVNPDYLGSEHGFKVLAVSSDGLKIPLAEALEVIATPIRKTFPPGNVESVALNITTESLQIDWPQVNEPDIKEYLVRFSPKTSGTWENSVPLLRTDKNTTLASTQARTGTYLIKAVDLNNNESEVAARAITTIPELFNLNILEEMEDFPTLEGNTNQVEIFGDTLVLKKTIFGGIETNEYYSEGSYFYSRFLDLGQIFTCRIQTLLDAEGFTEADLMANWTTLASVDALASSGFSDWDIEAYVRTTDNISIMANWTTLASVTTLSEGIPEDWTEWKKITSTGDYTGRIFQFKLRLISNKINITPRIFGGVLKIDMPDRVESYRDITANPSATINYSPAFYGPTNGPSIALTIDNQQSGDYYIFDSRTTSGFSITFYDKDNNMVSRTFDAQVKGYGRRATNSL